MIARLAQAQRWVDSRTQPVVDNNRPAWFFLTFEDGLLVGPFYASYTAAHALQSLSHRTAARDTLWIWV